MSVTKEQQALADAYESERNDGKADRLLVEVRLSLTKSQRDSLAQLVRAGPVWDGDVICKETRSELIKLHLAQRVMVKGRWGYTAATYLGGHVLDDRVESFS